MCDRGDAGGACVRRGDESHDIVDDIYAGSHGNGDSGLGWIAAGTTALDDRHKEIKERSGNLLACRHFRRHIGDGRVRRSLATQMDFLLARGQRPSHEEEILF